MMNLTMFSKFLYTVKLFRHLLTDYGDFFGNLGCFSYTGAKGKQPIEKKSLISHNETLFSVDES